jgi:hypothetical protein
VSLDTYTPKDSDVPRSQLAINVRSVGNLPPMGADGAPATPDDQTDELDDDLDL